MTPDVLVTGGTGYTGQRLVRRLVAAGRTVRALVRPASDRGRLPSAVEVVTADFDAPPSLAGVAEGVRHVFHLAHVRFTASLVAQLPATVAHLVVVSSQRAVSRVPSPSVGQVLAGEAALAAASCPWTILRPTMIFGDGDDRNIGRLVARVRRGAWVPMVGRRRRHQPVLVDDVVDAVLACPDAANAAGATYAIAGAAPLTWEELVATVGRVVGRRPRTVPLPAAGAARLLTLLETTGIRLPVHAEQVLRMLEDKDCDIGPARRDLGFRPLTFEDGLRRVHGPAGVGR